MVRTNYFDCIAFKRAAQEEIYEQIKGMTPAEEIAWFRQKAEIGPFGDLLRRISARNKKPDVLCCAEESVDLRQTASFTVHKPLFNYGEFTAIRSQAV